MSVANVKNKMAPSTSRPNANTVVNRAGLGSLAGSAFLMLSLYYFNILKGPWQGASLGVLSFGGSICMGSFKALDATVTPKANFRPITKRAVGVLCIGLGGVVLGVYRQSLPLKIVGILLAFGSNMYAFTKAKQIIRLIPQNAPANCAKKILK